VTTLLHARALWDPSTLGREVDGDMRNDQSQIYNGVFLSSLMLHRPIQRLAPNATNPTCLAFITHMLWSQGCSPPARGPRCLGTMPNLARTAVMHNAIVRQNGYHTPSQPLMTHPTEPLIRHNDASIPSTLPARYAISQEQESLGRDILACT